MYMYYSKDLEYIVSGYIPSNSYSGISYFASNSDNNYPSEGENIITIQPKYTQKNFTVPYENPKQYFNAYPASHAFTPKILLNPSRPKARFIDDNNEATAIADEIFGLMMNEKMPENISINVLPFADFKALHSRFGAWSSGILGFSLNRDKKIFVRENHLDSLMIVIGHEIGHVLTETLPNKHDEEAKAFAFSIEWAKTIKKHNIANLGLSIKDEIGFQPARNGLHDIAFSFVDFAVKKGRKAMELHNDLAKRYVSVFDRVY